MQYLKNLFLREINFCSPLVIQGLVFNLSLYSVSFFEGECLSRILLMESKKFWKEVLTLLSSSFTFAANLLQNSQESTLGK